MSLNKNNIFITNGQKLSGKDYIVKQIKEIYGIESEIISTVDVIKSMYEMIGYKEDDPTIKDKFRVVLSDAKDSIDKNLNNWTTSNCIERATTITEKCDGNFKKPIFIHNREPKKIELMVREFKKLGYVVKTLKIDAEWQSDTHINVTCHADANTNEYDYDIVFKNTKDVDKFNKNLDIFIDKYVTNDARPTLGV